jgi:hypothetical protein
MEMKSISPDELAKTAAQRWKETYFTKREMGGSWHSHQMEEKYDKLVRLGSTPKASEVDAIIGNTTWTQHICDEDGCDRVADMEIGEEWDYESSTARLCGQCLQKAIKLSSARNLP